MPSILFYLRAIRLTAEHGPATVLLVFNTFGPRTRPSDARVVSKFIVQGLNKEPTRLYGNGRQTCSLCYVHEMIGGFIR